MANFKLREEDDGFLGVPQNAVLVASGTDGAETFIERTQDTTVRIVVASVGVATSDGAVLEAVIEIDGTKVSGRNGPVSADTHVQTLQSAQVVVKPDQRLTFRAYPSSAGVRVLKTVIYTADV